MKISKNDTEVPKVGESIKIRNTYGASFVVLDEIYVVNAVTISKAHPNTIILSLKGVPNTWTTDIKGYDIVTEFTDAPGTGRDSDKPSWSEMTQLQRTEFMKTIMGALYKDPNGVNRIIRALKLNT